MKAFEPTSQVAAELELDVPAVRAVLSLLDDGATVPFIARYRKEATGGLDEVQIRSIEERRGYLVQLHERRQAVLAEIGKQGKLTDALRARIEGCRTKAELEDLYAPFKPKRRTRGTMAAERGLTPLADHLRAQPLEGAPEREARAFVDPSKDVADVDAALAGARDICAEWLADRADARQHIRRAFRRDAVVAASKTKDHRKRVTKFDDYAEHDERASGMASHRFLAVVRGETDGVLRLAVRLAADPTAGVVQQLERMAGVQKRSPWAPQLVQAVADGYKRLLAPRAAAELRAELKVRADSEAVEVFARNLSQRLLCAPFGQRTVLGIDPGQRTGCKCVVIDSTGKLLAHDTVYLVQGDGALAQASRTVARLCREHGVAAVAVGNGTHGRETETFTRDVLRQADLPDIAVVSVNEAGASVYSASDVARQEFPDLDVSIRGAISIARRFQDPLAELVKIDPQSIGVGQYQHDVQQTSLRKKLDEVVEDCVNAVGVEANTASVPLLARVAGVGPKLAVRIVTHRDECGPFASRRALLDVAGLGPKTFEQAAGFLRVRGGAHPLDASAVHPERYALVAQMARAVGVALADLVGNTSAIGRIVPDQYVTGEVGRFTLDDILVELQKPGRDPRDRFEAPTFRDDVRAIEDLEEGMALEGVVTNVTAFGAFVDVGVHRDGLVHISQLADRFVKNPSDVVSVGDTVRVRVISVDLDRGRISLSAKQQGASGPKDRPTREQRGPREPDRRQSSRQQPQPPGGRSGGGRPQPARQKSAGKREESDGGFGHNPFARHFRKP